MKIVKSLLVVAVLSASVWALPPKVEADRLSLQAKTALDTGDYSTACKTFDELLDFQVKNGVTVLPDTVYFHIGRANSGCVKWFNARAWYEVYLNKTGTTGKYYKEALEGYNKADLEYKKAAVQQKKDNQYELDMADYLDKMDLYKPKQDKCDYDRSSQGRREGCEKWAMGMSSYDQELVEQCIKDSYKYEIVSCMNLPSRPVEPKRPTRD